MQDSWRIPTTLFTAAFIAFAATAAAESATVVARPFQQSVPLAKTPGTLYVSTFADAHATGQEFGTIDTYNLRGRDQLPKTILWSPGGPGSYLIQPVGMATDQAGNLYATDTEANCVYVYAPGAIVPTSILNDAGELPWEVAIGADGTVYVANLFDANFGPGNIVAYAPGATKPTKTFSDINAPQVRGVAVDRAGDVYMSYNTTASSTGSVAVFVKGAKKATETHIGFPSGFPINDIILDRNGNLLTQYGNGEAEWAVFSSQPPYGQVGAFTTKGVPFGLAFGQGGRLLYVSDYGESQVEIYAYDPNAFTVRLINTITTLGLPTVGGIAVTPTLPTPI